MSTVSSADFPHFRRRRVLLQVVDRMQHAESRHVRSKLSRIWWLWCHPMTTAPSIKHTTSHRQRLCRPLPRLLRSPLLLMVVNALYIQFLTLGVCQAVLQHPMWFQFSGRSTSCQHANRQAEFCSAVFPKCRKPCPVSMPHTQQWLLLARVAVMCCAPHCLFV